MNNLVQKYLPVGYLPVPKGPRFIEPYPFHSKNPLFLGDVVGSPRPLGGVETQGVPPVSGPSWSDEPFYSEFFNSDGNRPLLGEEVTTFWGPEGWEEVPGPSPGPDTYYPWAAWFGPGSGSQRRVFIDRKSPEDTLGEGPNALFTYQGNADWGNISCSFFEGELFMCLSRPSISVIFKVNKLEGGGFSGQVLSSFDAGGSAAMVSLNEIDPGLTGVAAFYIGNGNLLRFRLGPNFNDEYGFSGSLPFSVPVKLVHGKIETGGSFAEPSYIIQGLTLDRNLPIELRL